MIHEKPRPRRFPAVQGGALAYPSAQMDRITTLERHVPLGTDHVFVQCWQPREPDRSQPPWLLFHESLGCVAMWRDFPAGLCAATGRAVFAYDRIGYGRSSPSARPPNLSFVTDEAWGTVAPLLDALGIGRFLGFGHSTGGSIALAVAGQLGRRCAGVVSESGHVFVEGRTLEGIARARTRFKQSAQFARLERHHGTRARWVLDTWTETWLAPWFRRWTLRDTLRDVDCPALLMQGGKDPYGSLDQLRCAASCMTGPVRPLVFPDGGHTPHVEQTAAVLAACARFADAQATAGPNRQTA